MRLEHVVQLVWGLHGANYVFNPDLELRSVAGMVYYKVRCNDPRLRADRIRCHEAALRMNTTGGTGALPVVTSAPMTRS